MGVSGPTQSYGVQRGNRWKEHPVLSRALRVAIILAPVAASFALTALLARWYPPERIGVGRWVWWTGVAVLSTMCLASVDRLGRRLLPTVALLNMSLLFPDQAPSRYQVALRTGTGRQLQRRIESLAASGDFSQEVTDGKHLVSLMSALNGHDRLTRGHCERVRAYADLIAQEMRLPSEDIDRLRWAALLHDVGKLAVPAEILNLPTKPTAEQWQILRTHPEMGRRIMAPYSEWLGDWMLAVSEHHERWDGGGYPLGLAGTEMHLGSRIVAVADAFDVMTSRRSYKNPMSAVEARQEIAAHAGTQFDPAVVRAFLRVGIGRLRLALGPLSWLTEIPILGRTPVAKVATTPIASAAGNAATAAGVAVAGALGGLDLTPMAEPIGVSAPESVSLEAFPTRTTTTQIPASTTPVPSISEPSNQPESRDTPTSLAFAERGTAPTVEPEPPTAATVVTSSADTTTDPTATAADQPEAEPATTQAPPTTAATTTAPTTAPEVDDSPPPAQEVEGSTTTAGAGEGRPTGPIVDDGDPDPAKAIEPTPPTSDKTTDTAKATTVTPSSSAPDATAPSTTETETTETETTETETTETETTETETTETETTETETPSKATASVFIILDDEGEAAAFEPTER